MCAWLFAHAISALKYASSDNVMLMAVFIFVMLSQFIADLSLSVINLNASTLLRCCGIGLAPVFNSPLQQIHLSLFGY